MVEDSMECNHGLSELMDIRLDAPMKEVSRDEYLMAWRILSPVLRFGHPDIAAGGKEALWCPGEDCWWTPKV